MIIWNFNQYAEPPGGQFSNPIDIALELTKRGHKIIFFASSFNHYKLAETIFVGKRKNEFMTEQDYNGVKFVFLKTHPYQGNTLGRFLNMLSYSWNAIRVARKIKERPDVISASCPHLFGVFAGYFASRLKKTHFFFEVRDLWPQTLVDMGALSDKNPVTFLLRLLEKFLYRMAEKIVTMPPFAYEYIIPLGISKEKIVNIPNGASAKRFENTAKTNPSANPFTLMYVGGFARYNNIDLILEVAKILENHKSLKFVLIGDGPEKSRLKEKAGGMELENVEFRKSIPKSEVPRVVVEASVFLYVVENFPTLKYGISPNKVFDYMASARPIIYSSISKHNPVKEAGAGINVEHGNAEELAKAVLKMKNLTPTEREQMGKRGLDYMKKFHDIPVLADKFESVYSSIL